MKANGGIHGGNPKRSRTANRRKHCKPCLFHGCLDRSWFTAAKYISYDDVCSVRSCCDLLATAPCGYTHLLARLHTCVLCILQSPRLHGGVTGLGTTIIHDYNRVLDELLCAFATNLGSALWQGEQEMQLYSGRIDSP